MFTITVQERLLTDGSKVYDVVLASGMPDVVFYCATERDALELTDALKRHASNVSQIVSWEGGRT